MGGIYSCTGRHKSLVKHSAVSAPQVALCQREGTSPPSSGPFVPIGTDVQEALTAITEQKPNPAPIKAKGSLAQLTSSSLRHQI